MKFVTICILLILISCAKSTDQKVADAIDQAQTFLSDGECDKALKVLDEVGSQSDHAIYLQVYASAYACKADFQMVRFISEDIEDLDTSSFPEIMTSLSILTLSDEKTPDSETYVGLRTALETLLQDGKKAPSQASRTKEFGPSKAGDMGIQILVYSLVQLGKFNNLYGDVNASGVKGGGSGSNACFIDYTFSNAQAVRIASGGSCNSNSSGHPGLSIVSPNKDRGNRRRCEGLMLFTNTLDVLNHLDLSENDTFKDLARIATQANSLIDTATTASPALETLLETTSQQACEKLLETQSESNNMELIYALLFETGLQ